MITPTTINLTIYQGATFQKTWAIASEDTGDAYSLVSWTARMQIRAKKKDTNFLLELTTENGGITIENSVDETTYTIYISPADTAALASGGFYDLELVDPQGDVIRIQEGKIVLSTEVTR